MIRTRSSEGRRAFEAIALEHVDGLFSLALHLTRNRADAEDLVQETILRAYTRFDRFERGTNFRAWIFTILRNLAINRHKRVKRRGIRIGLESIERGLEADAAPWHASEPHDFEVADIEAALRRLTEEYRLTFVLYALGGFTYDEIARIMDCPIGTVMSRLFRARRKLRDDLEGRDLPRLAPQDRLGAA
jgi:RNA polymerase sigma-70 factor (ECF subfamily)